MAKYRELAGAAKRLGVENAIIDVKLCLVKPAFRLPGVGEGNHPPPARPLFVVFDLLHLSGHEIKSYMRNTTSSA